MGHLAGKDVYRDLGRKIDGLPMRTPWNETLRAILTELYTAEEADLVASMPFGMSTLERIARVTGRDGADVRRLLDGLCAKGLVVDIFAGGSFRYSISPMVVGIFEFTMMRTDGRVDHKKLARLFDEYLSGDDVFQKANFGHGERMGLMRTVAHDGTLRDESHVEVLDYEKAAAIVESARKLAVGICSCRHEKHHQGTRACDVPMDNCSSFGSAAEFLVRHDMAREVSKEEMLDNVARSRDLGLVLNADNVQKGVTFICHCCGCCCNALAGLSRFGYTNVVLTSRFLASSDNETCKGCNHCEKACPVGAISMVPDDDPRTRKKKKPAIDATYCLGCGVCSTRCETGAMRLDERGQRVITPENTFQRVLLTALERGTLQNQLFDDPRSGTHAFLRGVVGGFLRLPPVKRALMSDLLRSRFLKTLEGGVRSKGGDWLAEI